MAAVLLIALPALRAVAGSAGETGGWLGVLASLPTGGWLILLQRRYGVRLKVPIFRIPLPWLMPVYLPASVFELVS